LEEINGTRVRCDPDCTVCAKEERLRLLTAKLMSRGLDARLIACGVAEDGRHYDAVTVINRAVPQRGVFHVDDDGTATWRFPGSNLDDDDAIGRMVDEAINALRANGMRLPQRKPRDQQPG
jgi:hypothetical protein